MRDQLNWYNYCSANPVCLVDPSGLRESIGGNSYEEQRQWNSLSPETKAKLEAMENAAGSQKLTYPRDENRVTSGFRHTDPGYTDTYKREHYALDMGDNFGKDVNSIGNGYVLYAGEDATLGHVIDVKYNNVMGYDGKIQNVVVKYAHLEPGTYSVKPGDTVTRNQYLAIMGHTGTYAGTDDHLHLELILFEEHKWLAALANNLMYPSATVKGISNNDLNAMLNPFDFLFLFDQNMQVSLTTVNGGINFKLEELKMMWGSKECQN